jgi:hypothetical protein
MTNEEKVKGWFKSAKKVGRVHINLYYSPLNTEFRRVAKERYLGKAFIGFEYEGDLYKVTAGPGDCEEILLHLGEI